MCHLPRSDETDCGEQVVLHALFEDDARSEACGLRLRQGGYRLVGHPVPLIGGIACSDRDRLAWVAGTAAQPVAEGLFRSGTPELGRFRHHRSLFGPHFASFAGYETRCDYDEQDERKVR